MFGYIFQTAFARGGGRFSNAFFVACGEIGVRAEAAFETYLRYGLVSCEKRALCSVTPYPQQIFSETPARHSLELLCKISVAHHRKLAQILNGDVLTVMLVDV